MKKSLKLGAACLGVALLLCACGKGSANSTDTAAGSETESAAQSASESASETETETEDTNAYAYDYDVESLVKLGDYKGLTYTETDTSVSDEEVESQINSTLTAHATPEQIKDRAVEDGDTVNIDYEGKIDGETFEGGTASGASLTIGSDSFIDGFEDGIIGMKKGLYTVRSLYICSHHPRKQALCLRRLPLRCLYWKPFLLTLWNLQIRNLLYLLYPALLLQVFCHLSGLLMCHMQ